MSNKVNSLVGSESNEDSSDDNSSKDRQDRSRAKYSEKRKKHKKHKKQKKSKKQKKERHSSDAERHSKSETRVALESDYLIESSLSKKTTRDSISPAQSKSEKAGKPNAKEVDLLKQVSSRWDSSGEGEHSRQTLDSKGTKIYRSDSKALNNDSYVDKERLNRQSLSHEQHKSTRASKSVSDTRDREHGQQGHRNENHYSRTFNKHGSNQQYGRDSSKRGNHDQASSSRDNDKKFRNSDPGHHNYQTTRDSQGERGNQSTTDKYCTSSRKRTHGDDSPYKQSLGREMSSQKQGNTEHQTISKTHIKSEKNSRYDEDEQHTWGKQAENRSKTFKSNDNVKMDSESAGASDQPASSIEKEKPNFGLSGKLTEEANKVNGVVIAYSEPPGARKPKRRWRLYPFKGDQALPTLYIHRQSCYLIGRDRKVCDLPVDHPSCSKQHAVLQYRLVPYERIDGTKSQCVRPYIIDLESSNGTFVNNKKIESKRYLELREKDVLKFGFSSREYVLLHENSKEDNEDDEGYDASPVVKTPNDSSQHSKVETK